MSVVQEKENAGSHENDGNKHKPALSERFYGKNDAEKPEVKKILLHLLSGTGSFFSLYFFSFHSDGTFAGLASHIPLSFYFPQDLKSRLCEFGFLNHGQFKVCSGRIGACKLFP